MMFNSIIFFIIPGVPHGPMALLDGTTAIGVGALMDLVEIGYGFGGLDEGGCLWLQYHQFYSSCIGILVDIALAHSSYKWFISGS
jgi:hypothetical protein